MTIRDSAAQDFPALVTLMQYTHSVPVNVQSLIEADERRNKNNPYLRMVLEKDGDVIGYCKSQRWEIPDRVRYIIAVAIQPEHRGQGLGAQLYDIASRHAIDAGANELWIQSIEGDEIGEGFAKRRGYTHCFYLQDLTLDLETANTSAYAGVVDDVRKSGITFTTFGALGDTPENRRKLYDLVSKIEADVPVFGQDAFMTFETWEQKTFESKRYDPEGEILALDGENWIGVGAVGEFEDGTYFNMLTGVLRPYRGRKIALALKLLGFAHAKSRGAKRMWTQNHGANAAMRSINQKLGYVGRPGWNTWEKRL